MVIHFTRAELELVLKLIRQSPEYADNKWVYFTMAEKVERALDYMAGE